MEKDNSVILRELIATCQLFSHTFDGVVEISSSEDKLMHAVTTVFF